MKYKANWGGRNYSKTFKANGGFSDEFNQAIRDAADEILKIAREYDKQNHEWNQWEANQILIPPDAPINTSIFEEAEVVSQETI